MSNRLPWGHESRHCARCGRVGPRVFNPAGFGYIHAYCRSPEEARSTRKRRRDIKARDMADLAEQFARDKERYFPEPPEMLS